MAAHNFKDMTGLSFGSWKVLHRDMGIHKWKTIHWMCECRCGTKKIIAGAKLRRGDSTKCVKCQSHSNIGLFSKKRNVLVGSLFGVLTVIEFLVEKNKKDSRSYAVASCECICGLISKVRMCNLNSRNYKKCLHNYN